MPSQSPTNGYTKYRTRAREMRAGGNHHFQARQNERATDWRASTPASRLALRSSASCVFVVGCIWINELSFNRSVWSLGHLHAITLRIVLNFVHYVVDKQDAPTGASKQVGRIAGIRNLQHIKALAFILDSKTGLLRRQLCGNSKQFGRVVFITVLDCVYESLIESDE